MRPIFRTIRKRIKKTGNTVVVKGYTVEEDAFGNNQTVFAVEREKDGAILYIPDDMLEDIDDGD